MLKPVRDGVLGRFEIPLLLMVRNAVQVALSPITRFAPNSQGGVDLYVVPAYDQVATLTLEDDHWFIYYAFVRPTDENRNPEIDRIVISEETLIRVMDMIVTHDLESL